MVTDERYSLRTLLLAAIPVGALVMGFAYAGMRMALFVITGYGVAERCVAGAVLGAETFMLVHGPGYFLQIAHIVRSSGSLADPVNHPVDLEEPPPVAVVAVS